MFAVGTQVNDIIDQALAIAMHAIQTTAATTLGSIPGALALSRDIIFNISHDANKTSMLTFAMQMRSNVNLTKLRVRKSEDVHDSTKLRERQSEPYTIERSHANGTLTIQLRTGRSEHINIQRIILCR